MNKYCVTKKELTALFSKVGLMQGMTVMLHTKMSSFGYVVNGPHDIIESVLDVIGPDGTLLTPGHSGGKTDPEDWCNPSVPKHWFEKIRKNMKPFNIKTTLVRDRGIVPNAFLLYDNIFRSNHPIKSILALGKNAKYISHNHPLNESEGVGSPIHKLYLLKGFVLLAGVGLESCTALHLSEFLADIPRLYKNNFKVLVKNSKGHLQFIKLVKYPKTSKHFPKLESLFRDKGIIIKIEYKDSFISLLNIYEAVNEIVKLLNKDSKYLDHDRLLS